MLHTLPNLVIDTIAMHLAGGRALLCLEAAARNIVSDRCWEALCSSCGYQQTGSRRRGRRPWKAVYLHHACVNCAAVAMYTLNSNCGSGRSFNVTFALCERCMAAGHELRGLQARMTNDQHQYQAMVHRVLAARRTIFEEAAARKRQRKAKAVN